MSCAVLRKNLRNEQDLPNLRLTSCYGRCIRQGNEKQKVHFSFRHITDLVLRI